MDAGWIIFTRKKKADGGIRGLILVQFLHEISYVDYMDICSVAHNDCSCTRVHLHMIIIGIYFHETVRMILYLFI